MIVSSELWCIAELGAVVTDCWTYFVKESSVDKEYFPSDQFFVLGFFIFGAISGSDRG